MHIIYKDIQHSRKDFLEKYNIRESELQDAARRFVAEYIDSLSLPSEVWVDRNNIPHPYIVVGFVNEKGLFQQTTFAALNLDEDYILRFSICTVIDDSASGSGAYVLIPIAMWKSKGRLYVELQPGEEELCIEDINSGRPFFEACVKLKQIVLFKCIDMRLD